MFAALFPSPSPESPPMFKSRFIDRFSRVHFAVVPALYIPAALIVFGYGLVKHDLPWLQSLALVVGGFFAWTLTEYWLHRTLFHWQPGGAWGERFHFLLHGVHHRWPRDRYRLVMPPAVSASLFWLFLALWLWLMGPWGFAFHAGYTIGYMYYDLMHYALHHHHPKSQWMKNLRKHHMLHHSPNGEHGGKFGVSIQLWDHVFRTR